MGGRALSETKFTLVVIWIFLEDLAQKERTVDWCGA